MTTRCPGCDRERPRRETYDRCRASGDWSDFHLERNAYYPCCNPLCGGDWGSGCHHCHLADHFPRNVWRRWCGQRGESAIVATPVEHWLLFAIAHEIDRLEATVCGRVCRACGGRGHVWAWEHRTGAAVVVPWGRPFPRPVEWTRTATCTPCACDGPTRLHTVLLAIELPRIGLGHVWPEEWLVRLDERLPVTDWIDRWWLALREWTHAGKKPDALALAHDLAALMEESCNTTV